MATRREFIKWTAASGVGLAVAGRGLLDGRALAVTSVAASLTPYLDPMPLLVDINAIDATGGGTVDLTTQLISRKLHSQLPTTTLFGYLRQGGPGAGDINASYLGPVIIAKTGTNGSTKVVVNYTNHLMPNDYLKVFTNGGSSYLQFPPFPEVRILTHLHGGLVAGNDDGNPFAQPDAFPFNTTQSVTYPNEQPATLSWYHDHYLGNTRMNVVAGLAGGYLIRDGFDTGSNSLFPNNNTNGNLYELPMVVQDRQFDTLGNLLYPVAPAATNGPWIGEYFGDVMMVNGKIWPALTVEPAVYRFRVLNGCNARILNLKITNPINGATVPMVIIGTEGGLLPVNPTPGTNGIVMTPAERYDVICDFRGFAGQTLLMKNGNPPNSVVSTPAPSLTKVMQITVKQTASIGAPMSVPGPGSLPTNAVVDGLIKQGPPKLSGGSVTPRMVTLNEVGAGTPAWRLNLNARPYGSTTVAENLTWNTTEDWYFVNTTPDTHPMHTHLFTFKVMGRYNFDAKGYAAANGGPNGVPQLDVSTLTPFLKGGLIAPPPDEAGLKETVKANPGQVTVVRATFTPPSTVLDASGNPTQQKYVHHCHIVEHEDNDMMERVIVNPPA
jgi:FtsP/CotA-like multicopper oxidase with cupredoxin domain